MKKLSVIIACVLMLPCMTHAIDCPLPDTGQTKCYDDAGEITCPQPGEDFYGQDAQYTPCNPQYYTKLDASGSDLPDEATEWVMVRDNVMGLIWEVKTTDGSIHDSNNTYLWQQAMDTFIPALNAGNFGGFSDWRMPEIEELATIVDRGRANPAININYFPNIYNVTYICATPQLHDPNNVWGVGFGTGRLGGGLKTNPYRVIAVRGENRISQNFIDTGNGTVVDLSTGLMWQQQHSTLTVTWEDALTYCYELQLSGYNDWRLPNANEILSLIDFRTIAPTINTELFPDTELENFWTSSTLYANPPGAWYASFNAGNIYDNSTIANKSNSYRVRSVRGGQCGPLFECITDADCDDNEYCNGIETCIGYNCQPGTPVDCPDDGLFCTGIEYCFAEIDSCVSSGDPCEVGKVCNELTDACDVVECMVDADCDDNEYCNGIETCIGYNCQCGIPVDCPDDGLFCTGIEYCFAEIDSCVSSGDPCSGGTICNEVTDSCDVVECTTDAGCDDNIYCNGIETCIGYNCQLGIPVNCPDDGLFCTGTEHCFEADDSCVSSGDPCSGGTICNEETDSCDVAGEVDSDDDGIPDSFDNCPNDYNPTQEDTDEDNAGDACDNCPIHYNPDQLDSYPPGGNDIGDACEGEGDFDCDGDADGTDAALFKADFGRSAMGDPCVAGDLCNGDFSCDGDVDGIDAALFKQDFGRSQYQNPCPACVPGEAWCVYP